MARVFNGTNTGLSVTTAIVAAYPFSWGCWFKGAQQAASLMSLNASATLRHDLSVASGGFLRNQQATSGNNATSAVAYTAGVWNHGIAICASNTDRRVYLNGGNRANNTNNLAFAAIDNLWVGAQRVNADWWNGSIAEAAIWNAALTDAEVAKLAAGISPLSMRPDKLVAYWPLYGGFSPEVPYKGTAALVLTNAPTRGDHVRIFGVI